MSVRMETILDQIPGPQADDDPHGDSHGRDAPPPEQRYLLVLWDVEATGTTSARGPERLQSEMPDVPLELWHCLVRVGHLLKRASVAAQEKSKVSQRSGRTV